MLCLAGMPRTTRASPREPARKTRQDSDMKKRILLGLLATALFSPQSAAQTVDTVLTNRLFEPYNIAAEASAYYVSESANHRIVRFIPETGAFTTLAGFSGRPGAEDGRGVYARFYSPRGLVAVPARGGLVVADYGNHTLRLVQLDGTVTTLAGQAGMPGFNPTPVNAATAQFNFPSALAADANGVVYIADSKNNAIRKLGLDGIVTTLAIGLNEPDGIAIGDNGDLWVSDSRNHAILRIRATGAIELVAGLSGHSGALDSIFASESLFNQPTGLLWLGSASGLLVCDTGNHALRQIHLDPELNPDPAGPKVYSVKTYAGTPTQSGFANGPLLNSTFNSPVGITKDPLGGFLIADLGNNTLRRIQTSKPLPPVREPVIGWVSLVKDAFGELLSSLVPVTQAVFNNDVTIAVLAEDGTETYFTYGPTPPSSLEDTIPSPNRIEGTSPPQYRDGLRPEQIPESMIGPQPDVTIKVIGTQDGRRPSAVVQARFQFKTANPAIIGDNAASFTVANITANAQMWYTTDGSDPEINGPTSRLVTHPQHLERSTSPIVFKVRAFRTNYKPSEIITKIFQPDDFQANRISFGFEHGEASSQFVASAGQTFFAPVTLSLLPKQSMYGLQFNVTVTNADDSPPVGPGDVGFSSMLKENIKDDYFITIPPSMYFNGLLVPPQIEYPPGYGDLRITNSAANLLAVGWLERRGETNLYNTKKQDLITYSIAHNNLFESKNQKVVVGGFGFKVPANALPGHTYQIQIGRPSATADGVGMDVLIEAPANGPISSLKQVSVGQRRYIVGDVEPFGWFNAGDFGDTNILNNDVMQIFQSAVYWMHRPPKGSDFYDAMDSSNGSVNNYFDGDDQNINDVQFGDEELNVDDVYVTFRRGLDPSLTWYARYWDNGVRQAEAVPNVFRGAPNLPGETFSFSEADIKALNFLPGEPSAAFTIDDLRISPGQTLQIPVRARVTGNFPLRVLMLNISVQPLDGSPPLAETVRFTPSSALGVPAMSSTKDGQNFAGAWLNNKVVGVAGETIVGHLSVSIPADAKSTAAYRLHFEHVSASPNGLALFPIQSSDGLLMLDDRSVSSLGDDIPDTWRLRYFGSVSNLLSHAQVDADGDGVSNWDEFIAGTNPMDRASHLRLGANPATGGPHGETRGLTLRWPSVAGKLYAIEAAPALVGSEWLPASSPLAGTGQELQFTPLDGSNAAQFYRVRLIE
jgi:hypothetical protein